MEQISQISSQQEEFSKCESTKTSFQFKFENKNFNLFLQMIQQRIEISAKVEGYSQQKWNKLISIEQAYKAHNFFLQFQNLEDVYQIFQELMKNSIKAIQCEANKMVISFEFQQMLSLGSIKFSIQLDQQQMNTNDHIFNINERIDKLEIQTNNHQRQLDESARQESSQAQQIKEFLAEQIQSLKTTFQRETENLKREHSNEINQLKNEIKLLQKLSSNILEQNEQEMVKKWITNSQINLQRVYRATENGFQIERIYQVCKNKRKLVFFIKTDQNRRFGFYTDCLVKNYNGYIRQNPNNLFIFSLDLKQKYSSNEQNYQDAFCSSADYLALGAGHDLALFSNSNANNSSYVDSNGYGKKEGLSKFNLNGGTKNFATKEIEIFEVIDI